VDIAVAAARRLGEQGVAVRVVSMPCVETFHEQDAAWRDAVLPPGVARISIEAGVTWFWRGVVGAGGLAIGIDSFGESAPAPQLYEHFGLTAARVAERALALLEVA
jgi:transketolase